MSKADEYFHSLLPLGGNPGTVSKVTLGLSPTPTSIDMRTLFGNLDQGANLTFKADGPAAAPGGSGLNWRAYFSLTPRTGTIAPGWSGLTPAASGFQAWPLFSGEEYKGRMSAGTAQLINTAAYPTGFATMVHHNVLNVACSIGSGLLHVLRSTVAPSQGAEQLRPPVGSAIFPPGPSGWIGPYP